MGKEQWEYGTGGLIDLCNGCRFDRNSCPVAQRVLSFAPVEDGDPPSLEIIRTIGGEETGTGTKFIENKTGEMPFVCVTFESRGISTVESPVGLVVQET